VRRYRPTLTLLPDGSVLVAGGRAVVRGIGLVSVRFTERFDPQTNRFAPLDSMTVSRAWHSAVRLQDGRVLLLGGIDGKYQVLAAAEVFDPVTGVFSAVGNMTEPRWCATATLLRDGRVLIAGGIEDRGANITTSRLSDNMISGGPAARRRFSMDVQEFERVYGAQSQTGAHGPPGQVPPARDLECDLLPGQDRLPVALPAARPPSLGGRLGPLLPLA
jgi:hypothetical protein